jgi:NADH-quinone oxidoreductase subunit M
LGTYITFPELLIWLPLLAGILCFIVKNEQPAKATALFASLAVLAISLVSLCYTNNQSYNAVNYIWLKYIGNSFYISLDGTGRILTLLTAVSFPIIFIATWKNEYKNAGAFYGLMLLAQCGLMGVFLAKDALLFYFFWELALIPVYFLCSRWGGERRIQATFKFFVYTFAGSLLMLTGIIYVYLHTAPRAFDDAMHTISPHSFAMQSFYNAMLNSHEQGWLFWLFFIAFAIKMPIFPFHTWQPDTYDQSPTSVTMVLSGIMVKMGLFGVIKWLIPLFPLALPSATNIVMVLSIIGIIYASCIAMVQDNLKKLVAYSSIAHIGLMCAAIFSMNEISVQGVMVQMFNHGINIIGLWIVIDLIEKQTGVKKMSQLGGIATKAPILTIMLIIIAFANIALPLTNAFIGEFMMFTGVYKHNVWMAVAAGLSVILSAVYTLNMIQKVFYGNTNSVTENMKDITPSQQFGLALIVIMIFVFGVYPQPMIDLTKSAVSVLVAGK